MYLSRIYGLNDAARLVITCRMIKPANAFLRAFTGLCLWFHLKSFGKRKYHNIAYSVICILWPFTARRPNSFLMDMSTSRFFLASAHFPLNAAICIRFAAFARVYISRVRRRYSIVFTCAGLPFPALPPGFSYSKNYSFFYYPL